MSVKITCDPDSKNGYLGKGARGQRKMKKEEMTDGGVIIALCTIT